jgi:hypothetical protein
MWPLITENPRPVWALPKEDTCARYLTFSDKYDRIIVGNDFSQVELCPTR